MTPHDRIRISLATARYLEALEREDDVTLAELWELAVNDPEMMSAFQDIHAGLVEELETQARSDVESAVTAAVEKHLPSAEIVKSVSGPVTVADVANELFRHTPGRLPAEAHALNERLRVISDELPTDLGLSQLIAWAEPRFGPAPAEYWEAFRKLALKVRMRRTADTEFRLAARQTHPKREGT